jgi:esterase/lipase superfamily enzyme
MGKESGHWHSERLQRELHLVRWGEVGTPVLLHATAGGDAEECERFHVIDALSPLLEAGRIKVYSLDAVGTRTLLQEEHSREHAAWVQNRFDDAVYHEVVPAIRADCRSDDVEIVVAGMSLGAWNALAALCRHPDVFRAALCLSGTYDLSRWMPDTPGEWGSCQPLAFLPTMPEGEHLDALRRRFVLLAHGTGRWEAPGEAWMVADLLGSKGIPNRVDEWGAEWDHDWVTWRRMLPQYLDELA